MLLHINYHFAIHVLRSEKRERTIYPFCYILIGFLRDNFLGLVSNIKQKVLSTPQGTECCQAP